MGNVNSFGIFANSKHPNEAWEFLKYTTGQAGNKVYGQLSDLPSNQADFNSMSSFITPSSYVPTLTSAEKGFSPIVMTPHLQYGTDLGNILTDLANAKITPAQAAAQIEQKGNADLAAS
jgi:multiple sugar transport system substrate-binding protein